MYNALKSSPYENGASKIYYETLVKNVRNIMITAKFGFRWMFFQAKEEEYAQCALTFYDKTQKMIRKLIQDENLDEL